MFKVRYTKRGEGLILIRLVMGTVLKKNICSFLSKPRRKRFHVRS